MQKNLTFKNYPHKVGKDIRKDILTIIKGEKQQILQIFN